MKTEYDFPDPPARVEMAVCHDCHEEQAVYGYVMLADGKIVPICYEHFMVRQRAAQQRAAEEKP